MSNNEDKTGWFVEAWIAMHNFATACAKAPMSNRDKLKEFDKYAAAWRQKYSRPCQRQEE